MGAACSPRRKLGPQDARKDQLFTGLQVALEARCIALGLAGDRNGVTGTDRMMEFRGFDRSGPTGREQGGDQFVH
jgi:hypothetical protein